MQEFSLIDTYFKSHTAWRSDVLLGIGDDCALLKVPENHVLAATIDSLVLGTHFFKNTASFDLGHKALAIGLSDLAAMGATPSWATLAITLPKADQTWLRNFSDGFFDTLKKFSLALIGGNTTRGPLSITTSLYGFLPHDRSLRRNGAREGDLIYVTGTLGDAGLALQILQNKVESSLTKKERQYVLNRLNRPQPRVLEGQALLGIATTAIDISDGLALDLTHVLESSKVGAVIYVDDLPLSFALGKQKMPLEKVYQLALSGGEDYELCFTISKKDRAKILFLNSQFNCGFKEIGVIRKNNGLQIKFRDGKDFSLPSLGYEHKWR